MELDIEGDYEGKSTGFDPATSTLYLYFKDATAIEAGKPYLVKWTTTDASAGQNPTFADVTITSITPSKGIMSQDGKVSFLGNYSPVTVTGEDKTMLYLSDDNTLFYPNTAMSINAFRAYFQLNDGLTAGEQVSGSIKVRNFVLSFGDEKNSTGIVSIDSGIGMMDDKGWYTLDGRKLSGKPTVKGIYIKNGKKVIIK